jgi:hypothetical protein
MRKICALKKQEMRISKLYAHLEICTNMHQYAHRDKKNKNKNMRKICAKYAPVRAFGAFIFFFE